MKPPCSYVLSKNSVFSTTSMKFAIHELHNNLINLIQYTWEKIWMSGFVCLYLLTYLKCEISNNILHYYNTENASKSLWNINKKNKKTPRLSTLFLDLVFLSFWRLFIQHNSTGFLLLSRLNSHDLSLFLYKGLLTIFSYKKGKKSYSPKITFQIRENDSTKVFQKQVTFSFGKLLS